MKELVKLYNLDDNEATLLDAYIRLTLWHIRVKTVWSQIHEKSEEWYDFAFDVFHSILEKKQDLGLDDPADEDTIANDLYSNIETIVSTLEKMVKEKNSVGMDNLLRGLADKAEFHCGNARCFVNEESEEEADQSGSKKESKIEKKYAIIPPPKK